MKLKTYIMPVVGITSVRCDEEHRFTPLVTGVAYKNFYLYCEKCGCVAVVKPEEEQAEDSKPPGTFQYKCTPLTGEPPLLFKEIR